MVIIIKTTNLEKVSLVSTSTYATRVSPILTVAISYTIFCQATPDKRPVTGYRKNASRAPIQKMGFGNSSAILISVGNPALNVLRI